MTPTKRPSTDVPSAPVKRIRIDQLQDDLDAHVRINQRPDDVLKGQGNAFIFNVILEMQLHIQMRDLYERYDYPHPTGDYTNLPLINGFALQPDTFYET